MINRGTVNCAKLVNFDEKSCGSVMHTVDKLLIPPTKSILDIVNSNENYSILSKLIQGTEVEEILKDEKQSVTLLAPTDEIFDKVDEKELNVLLENKEKANEVLKHHILTGEFSNSSHKGLTGLIYSVPNPRKTTNLINQNLLNI